MTNVKHITNIKDNDSKIGELIKDNLEDSIYKIAVKYLRDLSVNDDEYIWEAIFCSTNDDIEISLYGIDKNDKVSYIAYCMDRMIDEIIDEIKYEEMK